MNQQRRHVLKASVAVGVVISAPILWMTYNNSSKNELERFIHQLSIPNGLETLRDQMPDAFTTLKQRFASTIDSESGFLNAINAAISAEFQSQDWLQINQWYLSRTECLLAAAAIGILGIKAETGQIKTFENAPEETFLEVVKWGPQETYQGVKFNEQPDGHCGFWAVVDNMPDGMRVFIGGKERNMFPNEKGFTSGIYKDVDVFINEVGHSDIVVYDEINHRKQLIGRFEVLPPFEFYRHPDGQHSQVFGPVENWGPNPVALGEVFNLQPNGHAAFWIKVNSMSNQVNLLFNNQSFKATVRKGLITSSFSPKYIPKDPGKYPVFLKDLNSNEQILVGELQVLSQN